MIDKWKIFFDSQTILYIRQSTKDPYEKINTE